MARWIVGRNGIIENVVGGDEAPIAMPGEDVIEDTTGVANVGGTYDLKEVQMQRQVADAVLRVLFRHENYLRQLNRALRASGTAGNNAATAAGLPTAAQSADLTFAQARAAFKALLA